MPNLNPLGARFGWVLIGLVSAATGSVINLATEWKTNKFAWVAVILLSLLLAGISHALAGPSAPAPAVSSISDARFRINGGRGRFRRHRSIGVHAERILSADGSERLVAYTAETAVLLLGMGPVGRSNGERLAPEEDDNGEEVDYVAEEDDDGDAQ